MHFQDFENSLCSGKPEISYCSISYLSIYVPSFINLAMPDINYLKENISQRMFQLHFSKVGKRQEDRWKRDKEKEIVTRNEGESKYGEFLCYKQ